jgi:hypothetical protein
MQSEEGQIKRQGLRRVSRARILDGHPLKTGAHAILVMVSVYVGITSGVSLFFAYSHEVPLALVLWTLLPAALLGYVLLVMERLLGGFKVYVFSHMGKLLTAFLLFFVHIIGYLALSSLIISYPLGYILEMLWDLPGMAGQYSLFSANFFIVLAVLSWLRNMRTPPCRCL